ncbi:MAG: SpoIIIAH-like family protein [Clostridiaceae bacterium]|nr:SpoIIIAH-like family protein [Clostridiaceae bacterium]
MKKVVRKNQIIITALAIMIVVAGYLNFTGQEISTSGLVNSQSKETSAGVEDTEDEGEDEQDGEDSVETSAEEADSEEDGATDISAEDDGEDGYTVNEDGEIVASEENPGEAVMVSNTLSSDYFSSAKLSREQSRAKNKETLMEIINNEDLSSKDKKSAVNEVATITKWAEQENAAELMLEAKGFSEAVVSISSDSADVVVNAEELSEQQMAQIEDIVRRKTDVAAENIVITPVTVEEE